MSNVIAFRRPAERHIKDRRIQGATLFVHIKNASLIAHLAKPLGQRDVGAEKANRS
ncbi:hypothetical protein [uncultured Boseongicola sp.]|uniref:hypothetical protein n=1 Tax=uncultured Boseongicola sp. TaxID=1648499 RepID=UPI00260CDEE7|nr:hypothetical protein [uncultured Boseongicola sp.]